MMVMMTMMMVMMMMMMMVKQLQCSLLELTGGPFYDTIMFCEPLWEIVTKQESIQKQNTKQAEI